MDNEEKKSRIIIEFSNPSSAQFGYNFENVSPFQVALAAWFLDKQAESGYFQQEMMRQQQQEMNKIAVPTGQVRQPILKPK